MSRRLRIKHADAIYNIMARSDARQVIVGDDVHRHQLIDGLEKAIRRELYMPSC